jgi:hypothetical protein
VTRALGLAGVAGTKSAIRIAPGFTVGHVSPFFKIGSMEHMLLCSLKIEHLLNPIGPRDPAS